MYFEKCDAFNFQTMVSFFTIGSWFLYEKIGYLKFTRFQIYF